jgi:di/tricarboxylate transporter
VFPLGPLTAHGAVVFALTLVAFWLFTRPRVRIELTCLLLIGALAMLFHFFPFSGSGGEFGLADALGGFSHQALIAICSLMILGRGLVATGALEPAVWVLARVWRFNRHVGLLVTLLAVMMLSTVLNDTPVLVLALPLILGVAERTGYPASKALMPVNHAILVGGMATTIGTSTNLLVVSIAHDMGVPQIGIFDFAPIVLLAAAIAFPWLWLVAPRLLPDTGRRTFEADRRYRTTLELPAGTGLTVAQLARRLGREPSIVSVERGDETLAPDGTLALRPGDRLVVADTLGRVRELATAVGARLFDDTGLAEERATRHLAEVIVGPEADVAGTTVREARFAERHAVAVAAVCSTDGFGGRELRDLGDHRLEAGDILLVAGPENAIERLRATRGFLLLDGKVELPYSPRAPLALAIMAGAILAAALGLVPIALAAFFGVILMLVTGCVRLEGIGRALSLEVILLVAASIALGRAFVTTGVAEWLGALFTLAFGSLPAAAIVALLMTFTGVLTNFVSNAAAASVATPVAVAIATQLGAPPEPFVLAVLFGCNLSFATPMAYQTNVMIMGAVGYRFGDFVRVGLPLAIIMLVALSVLLVERYSLA